MYVKSTDKEYKKAYFRIHQEIYNALISFYYLKGIQEVNPLDKHKSTYFLLVKQKTEAKGLGFFTKLRGCYAK